MPLSEDPIKSLHKMDDETRLDWCMANGHNCRLCDKVECLYNVNYVKQINEEGEVS